MKIINSLVALLLASATTALGLFFIGSQEEHHQLLVQHFWQTLGLRVAFAGSLGLVGAGLWWGINYALLKSQLVRVINLRKTALLLLVGSISGSLVGALLFCFA